MSREFYTLLEYDDGTAGVWVWRHVEDTAREFREPSPEYMLYSALWHLVNATAKAYLECRKLDRILIGANF